MMLNQFVYWIFWLQFSVAAALLFLTNMIVTKKICNKIRYREVNHGKSTHSSRYRRLP